MDNTAIEQLRTIGTIFSDFVFDNYDWLINRAIAYWALQSTQFDNLHLYQPAKHQYNWIGINSSSLIFHYYNSDNKAEEHFSMWFDLLDDRQFELWADSKRKSTNE